MITIVRVQSQTLKECVGSLAFGYLGIMRFLKANMSLNITPNELNFHHVVNSQALQIFAVDRPCSCSRYWTGTSLK